METPSSAWTEEARDADVRDVYRAAVTQYTESMEAAVTALTEATRTFTQAMVPAANALLRTLTEVQQQGNHPLDPRLPADGQHVRRR